MFKGKHFVFVFRIRNRFAKINFGKTGNEAVGFCKNIPDIDLILMNIKLSEIDDYETTQKIKKFNKDLPIIAQTANALADDFEKALNDGCSDYIANLLNRKLLLGNISKMHIYDNQ